MITPGEQSDQMQPEVTDESRSRETFQFVRELAVKHLSLAFSFSSFAVSFANNVRMIPLDSLNGHVAVYIPCKRRTCRKTQINNTRCFLRCCTHLLTTTIVIPQRAVNV